jgi:hypothetical protein
LLKHLPGKENVVWEKENLRYGYEGKPYSVRELPKKLRAPSKPALHVAGDQKVLAEALKSYSTATAQVATEAEPKVASAKDAAAAKKKKKAKDDEYEEVIDPVTGKKVKRKKKKEAKKEEEKKPSETAVASTPVPQDPGPQQDERTDAAAIAAAIAQSAATGDLPLPIKNSTLPPFASLEDWERLLLQRPDLAETKVFIQSFKNHTVSSDIYYKIAKMMLNDSRPEMKSLGVLVAGSNASVMSFQMLAGVAKSGSGDPKTNAQKYIDAYSNSISNLQILLGVLRGTDGTAAAAALHEFDQAATKFLANNAASTGGGGVTRGQSGGGTAAQFKPFVQVLQTLSHSTDATLASQAGQSLNHLEGLLGGSGSGGGGGTNVAATP